MVDKKLDQDWHQDWQTGSQQAAGFNQVQISEQGRAYAKAEQERRATERRNRIAEGFAFACVAADVRNEWDPTEIAVQAVEYADALIKELDK